MTQSLGARNASPSRDASPSAGRSPLLACVLSSSLVGMDSMMTTVALPAIADDLGAGLAAQQWVVAAFLLALGSLLLLGGAVGDALDRWRVFAAGTAAFGVAALGCALAPTAALLVAARLLQGAAAAFMVPGALAVITSAYAVQDRSRAIARWASWSGLSVVAGPVLGGVLVESVSWRATYGVLASLSLAVVVVIARATPTHRPRPIRMSSDWTGGLLGVPAVGGPVVALVQGPEIGWSHPVVGGGVVVGVAAAATFGWRERQAPHPLLPAGIFRDRTFTALNVVTGLLYAALIASGVYTLLFLQQTAGYGPTAAGLTAAIPVVVLLVLSRWLDTMTELHSPRVLIGSGALVAGAGMLLMVRTDAEADFWTVVLPALLVHGVGLTLLVAPLTAGVLAAAGDRYAGIASGVNNAVARLGSLCGVAVTGAVISTRYAALVDGSIDRERLSVSLQGGVDAARRQPLSALPDTGAWGKQAELVEGALSDAAVGAFRLGIGLLGGLAVLAGAVAITALRSSGGVHR